MMLEISDINSWKNFFDLIYDSSNTIELKLDQEKCKITVLSKSHVAFYDAEYSKDFFDDYQVDEVESIWIPLEDFYKILKSAHKNDVLVMESHDNLLKMVFEHDCNRRVFEFPLEADYGDVPPLPSIDHDTEFDVLLNDLKKPCEDLDKIVGTNKFIMVTESDELHITSPTDSMTNYLQVIDIDEVVSSKSIVDLAYIQQLLKLNKISETIHIKIGNDIPLKWDITSALEDIKITGLIAPIIEEEE